MYSHNMEREREKAILSWERERERKSSGPFLFLTLLNVLLIIHKSLKKSLKSQDCSPSSFLNSSHNNYLTSEHCLSWNRAHFLKLKTTKNNKDYIFCKNSVPHFVSSFRIKQYGQKVRPMANANRRMMGLHRKKHGGMFRTRLFYNYRITS